MGCKHRQTPFGPYCLIAPTPQKREGPLDEVWGLTRPALVGQIRAVDAARLVRRLGRLSPSAAAQVLAVPCF